MYFYTQYFLYILFFWENLVTHVISQLITSNLGCALRLYLALKNSLIIHEENTKKNHKRVVYVIQIHVDLHKL
jgi:hypothetical protein